MRGSLFTKLVSYLSSAALVIGMCPATALAGEVVATRTVAAGKTGVTVKGLEPGKTAWVQVRPVRSAGEATYSGILMRAEAPVKVAGKSAKAQSAAPQARPQAAGGGLVAAAL